MKRYLVIAVVAVVVVVAGAVILARPGRDEVARDGGESEPALPPGWATVSEPSGLAPLSLSEEPLWGSDGGPLAVVSAAEFRGDTAVLLGGDEGNWANRIAVVDAATGTPRWQLGELDELQGGDGAAFWAASDSPLRANVVDQPDGGWAVLVPYIASPCPGWCLAREVDRTTEFGLAALSSEDGHVLWRTPVVPAVPMTDPPPEEATLRALLTSEELAVVVVEPGDVDYDPSSPAYVDALQVIAIDPASGSTLWDVSGVRPEAIVGDTVLAGRPGTGGAQAGTSLAALDAGTGRTRWDLAGRWPSSRLALSAGDVALVEVAADPAGGGTLPLPGFDPGGVRTLALDLATGDEVADIGTGVWSCATDRTALVACALPRPGDPGGDRVLTLRLDDHGVGVSQARFDGLQVDGVWDGRVFVTAHDPPQPPLPDHPDTSQMDPDEAEAARQEYQEAEEAFRSWTPIDRRWSVDPSGTPVDEEVPGTVLAGSDRYAVVVREGEGVEDEYTVHRLD